MEGAFGFLGVGIHSMLFNGLAGGALGLLGVLGFQQMFRMFILRRGLVVKVRRQMTPGSDRDIVRTEFECNEACIFMQHTCSVQYVSQWDRSDHCKRTPSTCSLPY